MKCEFCNTKLNIVKCSTHELEGIQGYDGVVIDFICPNCDAYYQAYKVVDNKGTNNDEKLSK